MKNLILVNLLLALAYSGFAQAGRIIAPSTHAWYMENGTIKLNEKWLLFHDVQFRRADLLPEDQQLLLRAGIGYNLSSSIQIMAGYCFVQTYPYGDFPVRNQFPENRLWQQLILKAPIGRAAFINRYRLEQRYLGNSTTGSLANPRFENRARYLGRVNIPLQKGDEYKLYGFIYDEIFINFGKNVGVNIYDQNRIAAGLGWKLDKKLSLELGYMNQMVQQRALQPNGKSVVENNHTLIASLVSNL
ncbi:MAG: DUF2490 domain-containing protein [Haliscomenobacter sp.]|nr:DUF2490 domain-containing protein [Haliscomenobacter sp.]MBK9489921.1 DUF2490 domain-containing protein [Haliscomenobacter sp.]